MAASLRTGAFQPAQPKESVGRSTAKWPPVRFQEDRAPAFDSKGTLDRGYQACEEYPKLRASFSANRFPNR